jgi:hypothetical protein
LGNNAPGIIHNRVNAFVAGVQRFGQFANIIKAIKVAEKRDATDHVGDCFGPRLVAPHHRDPPRPASKLPRDFGANPAAGAGNYCGANHKSLPLCSFSLKGLVAFKGCRLFCDEGLHSPLHVCRRHQAAEAMSEFSMFFHWIYQGGPSRGKSFLHGKGGLLGNPFGDLSRSDKGVCTHHLGDNIHRSCLIGAERICSEKPPHGL